LSAIDAKTATLTVNEGFTFIGSQAFSSTDASGQLHFDALTHTLSGSTDADSQAEFSIQLTGISSLSASDFIL
jgi:hypothetical protein